MEGVIIKDSKTSAGTNNKLSFIFTMPIEAATALSLALQGPIYYSLALEPQKAASFSRDLALIILTIIKRGTPGTAI